MLQDGELVRSIPSGSTVGFTNDGTTNSLIGGKKFETSGFKLAIYDEFETLLQHMMLLKQILCQPIMKLVFILLLKNE